MNSGMDKVGSWGPGLVRSLLVLGSAQSISLLGSPSPVTSPTLPQEHPIPMSVPSPLDVRRLLNLTSGRKRAREPWKGLGRGDALYGGSPNSSMRPDRSSSLRTLCLCMGWFLCQERPSRFLFLTSSYSSFKTHLEITFRSSLPHLLPGGAVLGLFQDSAGQP